MQDLILVKLGGSLVTDKTKPFTARFEAIKRLAEEIAEARKKRMVSLILGNGAGSYAHTPALEYQTSKGIINQKSVCGFVVVQDAAARLNRIVVKELLAAGENVLSINPSSCLTAENGRIKDFFLEPILKLLTLGIIPVVYGDVVVDKETGCSIISTEKLLNFLALKLSQKNWRVGKVIHLGTTAGVLDENGKTILKITPGNFPKMKKMIQGSNGIDVTGGMLHKVEEALSLAKKGIPSYISNGSKKDSLKRMILGERTEGTLITQ